MQIIVDNKIIRLLISNSAKIQNYPLIFDANNCLGLRWPSLLECLELGSILSNLPEFDQNHPLFQACIAALCEIDFKHTLKSIAKVKILAFIQKIRNEEVLRLVVGLDMNFKI